MSDRFPKSQFSDSEWKFYEEYLMEIVWYNIFGFEELARIKARENYELDKKYLQIMGGPKHYLEIKRGKN